MDPYWARGEMGLFINDDSFGVPKHSELEPDYVLVKGMDTLRQTAA